MDRFQSALTESPWPRPEYDPDYESTMSLIRHQTAELLKTVDLFSKDSKVKKALEDHRFYVVAALQEIPGEDE